RGGVGRELPEPLTTRSTTGLLRETPARTVERWIDAAAAAGLIRASNDQYRMLSLTPLGHDVMTGRVEDVQMAIPLERIRAPRRKRVRSGRGSRNRHPRTGDLRPAESAAVLSVD